ncbi:MAG: HAD-IC family P-type ATPase [bacterium]|nr:HAD-IC family P-type ATPase [bacterium]
MKQIRSIIIRNFISPISIAIFLLAIGLLALGEDRDAWFISVVILINSAIGSIQEIRAYLTLKKIELMSQPRARLLKEDGSSEEILFSNLKSGDKILLQNGDEVPADAKIITSNGLEINESMLTGESIPITKSAGEKVLASAIVVAGDAVAEVLAVGDATESGQMTARLKSYKPQLTPIQKNIQRLITYLTYFAIFLAIVVIFRYKFLGQTDVVILKTITSAVVVLVPEGLLLASSLFFAYGSLKLLQAKVLPQKISAIEDMALLEVLATDKTGTLTSPEIEFNDFEILDKDLDEASLGAILTALNSQSKDKNATARAILKQFSEDSKKSSQVKISDFVPFSSSRKLSAATLTINKKSQSVVFGAPEFILRNFADSKLAEQTSKRIETLASKGLRVLLLAEFAEKPSNKKLENLIDSGAKFRPLAIVTLKNSLRENVRETVDFLQNRGVSIRVISGDNPLTVSHIAAEAGVKNAEKFITGAELAEFSEQDFEAAVLENSIFARVLPDQKEKIIGIFQKNQLYTGMIGDGVNDALAIKKADLGISMFDAAPATRRVADLVLMDNSFTSLPSGVKIGNRIMLSIEMIAILFFHKIIFGTTILFITMILGLNYPFLPRHITYMNFILVTMPTILVTLFPPLPTRKISPKDFWRDTLGNVAPIAVLTGVDISVIYVGLILPFNADFINFETFRGLVEYFDAPLIEILPKSNFELRGILATVVISTAYFGFLVAILGEKMLHSRTVRNTRIRRLLYLAGTIVFTGAIFGNRFLRDFFEFNLPSGKKIWFVLGVIILASIIQIRLMRRKRDK